MGMGRGFKWRGVLLGLTAALALVVFVGASAAESQPPLTNPPATVENCGTFKVTLVLDASSSITGNRTQVR